MGVNDFTVKGDGKSGIDTDTLHGFDRFFAVNDSAKIYIAEQAGERCYGWKKTLPHYNGIRRGMLKEHASRFIRARGRQEILPGVWLLAHSTPGLEKMGKKAKLYRRQGLWLRPDDFRHEQSLIFAEAEGLGAHARSVSVRKEK